MIDKKNFPHAGDPQSKSILIGSVIAFILGLAVITLVYVYLKIALNINLPWPTF